MKQSVNRVNQTSRRSTDVNPQNLNVIQSGRPEWIITEYQGCRVYDGDFTIYALSGYPLYKIPGRVVVRFGLASEVYLCNPPQEIRQLPHGPCLQLLKPGSQWFKLHWEKPAYNFDDSLAYVEDLLSQIPHRVLHELNDRSVSPTGPARLHPINKLIRKLVGWP